MSPSTSSQSVARPVRACFQCRDHILGEIPAAQQAIKARDTRLHTAEPAARGSDQRGDDIITEALAQCGSQVADPVGQAELDRGVAGPVLPGEQGFFWALEPRATASLTRSMKPSWISRCTALSFSTSSGFSGRNGSS